MYKTLKNKNFRNLLIGQAISQFGDAGYYFMFIFLVSKITQSSSMVSYMGALEALPFLILGPFAGSIADRIDRKKIMLSADLLSAALLTILGIITFGVQNPSIILLFGTATTLSIINTFFAPAKGASIPRLVDEEHLIEANSLSIAVQSMMPLFGSTMIGILGANIMQESSEYFLSILAALNALTFLGSAFFISLLPKIQPERKSEEQTEVLKDTLEGIKYILKRPAIRAILLTEAIVTIFVAPINVTLLKVNQVWFDENPKIFTYGHAGLFLGWLISSLIVSKIKINRPAPYYIFALILAAIGVTGLAFCKTAELLVFTTFIVGIPSSFAYVPAYTYIQHIVKDEFRGRVNGAINMVTLGITPFSMIMIGKILDILTLPHTFFLMGIGILIPILIILLSPEFLKATFKDTST